MTFVNHGVLLDSGLTEEMVQLCKFRGSHVSRRILDVKDDLSWALFFYSGAASVVGQSYTGAVL